MRTQRLSNTLPFLLSTLLACGGAQPEPVAPSAPEPQPEAVTLERVPAIAPPAAPEAKPAAPPSLEPADVGPTIYKKVFENADVRAFEVTFNAGDKIGVHKHPDHVVYVIEGGKLKITGADGKGQDFDLKAGTAMFLPAQSHSAENVGTSKIRVLVTELTTGNAKAAPKGGDPIKVGAKLYKKVFEDAHVRVLEVSFAKGAKIGKHTHPDHLAYVLEGGKLKITPEKGEPMEVDLKPGQAMFLDAQAHAGESKSDTPIKAVIVEFKGAAPAAAAAPVAEAKDAKKPDSKPAPAKEAPAKTNAK